MTSSNKHWLSRVNLLKQFLFSFIVGFFSLFTMMAVGVFTPAREPVIYEEKIEPQSKFLLSADRSSLTPSESFNLKIAVDTASPIYFAQAIIEYDPQVLEPQLPPKILHQLPNHAYNLIAQNLLRISATSLKENKNLNDLKSLIGVNDLVAVTFKVKPDVQPMTTKLVLQTPKLNGNQVDWLNSSALATITSDGNVVNILNGETSLEIKVISPANFNDDFYNLFNIATDSATEVIQSSESAGPVVNVSAEVLPPPAPQSVSLPIWQRFFVFLSTLLGL